jgi:F-type H+-transporting ATPase subunit delta
VARDKSTSARPYAKAAFNCALSDKKLAEWSSFLQAAALVCLDENMAPLLIDPRISKEKLYQLFSDICDHVCVQGTATEKTNNFLKVLVNNKRLNLLSEISVLFENYRAEQERTMSVDVTTFLPLTEQQQNRIRDSLRIRLNREISLQCHIDSSILGGLIIRAGDLVIDGSVLGQLQKLRESVIA